MESIKAGRLQAAFLNMPFAFKLREQGVGVKVCYLGHRDGSTLMVRKDSPARSLKDLRGKRIAIPSKLSNQNLILRRLMEKEGVSPDEIEWVELTPPDMPGALAVGAVDGFFVGEPHPARSELDGTGRVLYHVKDIWPRFISCCLVVTDKLIAERRPIVADLVRGIAESGEWAETHRLDAARIGAAFFRQDERVVRHVLTRPPDRVSYRRLTPEDSDLDTIQDLGVRMGLFARKIPLSEILDRSFAPTTIRAADIQLGPEPIEP